MRRLLRALASWLVGEPDEQNLCLRTGTKNRGVPNHSDEQAVKYFSLAYELFLTVNFILLQAFPYAT